ncbi:hypothetical protein EBB07_06645 [Paenibacillaceae bacterium]|nr:hypothetical protein EBB07_06645 [Paenibacillaceae bacterium]
MTIPQISIRQEPTLLSIEAGRGRQNIEQSRPSMNMRQVQPELRMETTNGYLEVNQQRMWDAMGLGGHLNVMSRIYSAASDIAMRGIARRVEDGNRLAQIHLGGNPLMDMAADWRRSFSEFEFRGPASVLNIDMRYTPSKLSIDVTDGRVDLDVQVNRPVHHYELGRLNIYVSQYGKVEITPPTIDATI